ncbi:SnoaL-like domain protein [Rickettsiales endosymbiont of Paramecium tredecaurelia]|uniref:nuclear transport factor 2 family protein n=1 Tax=Candidatus Sarmatiella mevalonica TaxID=2770581 RepID=UPI0019238ED0|nr:nuclear transport factor 2 family protein [Candidatus Sarmatiella mevalonica]MBL3284324.1 SnoaL-like domain protein [Candidatus Sarmatiella mevalonica]
MNTSVFESNNNLAIAKNYYNAMLAKDFDKMAGYLHNDVHFLGPLAEMYNKDAVVTAAKNFAGILQDIKIRSRFAAGDQIMFAYDMTIPAPIGKFRAAVLMGFRDGLISKIELFYDATPFQEKKSKIFEDDN